MVAMVEACVLCEVSFETKKKKQLSAKKVAEPQAAALRNTRLTLDYLSE